MAERGENGEVEGGGGRKGMKGSSPFGLVCSIVPRHDDLILFDVDSLLLELSSQSLEKLDSLGLIDD